MKTVNNRNTEDLSREKAVREEYEKIAKERIQKIFEESHTTAYAIARKAGLNERTMYDQLNGNSKISISTLFAVMEYLSDFSTDWLIRGEGEMYRHRESAPYINLPGAHDNAQHFGSGDINVGTTGKKNMTKDEMLQTLLQQQQQIINLMKE